MGQGVGSNLWGRFLKRLRRKEEAPERRRTLTGYGRLYPSGSNELLAEVTFIIHKSYIPGRGSEDWWGVLRALRTYPAYEFTLHEDAECRLELRAGRIGEIVITRFHSEPSAGGPTFFRGRGKLA